MSAIQESQYQTAIAIVGVSGRFPRAGNTTEFWQAIVEGRDCISQVAREYWNMSAAYSPLRQPGRTYSNWLGALDDIDQFDPLFFSISPVDANSMDPQQRLFLQEAWHCFEDAGYCPSQLAGSKTGVFVGCGTYGQSQNGNDLSAAGFLGGSPSILAGRIAYLLDLRGPCLAIDTACSSSLVAIAQACDSLVLGTSDLALAGGAAVLVDPSIHIKASQAGMLSPDGRCFSFDQRANGLVPGEGIGAVLLKRVADALRDNDPIYGTVIGWGVNQDGKTKSITAPSQTAQSDLQKSVFRKFAIDPRSIGLMEAHGTGTRRGDPIEVAALIDAYRPFTTDVAYCALGSVKSNIGHLQAASGVAGFLKALLALKHRTLPPTIQFEKLNEHIVLDNSPFFINTVAQDWPAGPDARRAAVSSFGFSGTNAYVVLEEYLAPPRSAAASIPEVVVLSAQNEDGLCAYAEALLAALRNPAGAGELLRIDDIAYTLQVGRMTFELRLALVAASIDELSSGLTAFLTGQANSATMFHGRSARDDNMLMEKDDIQALVDHWLAGGKLEAVARCWVQYGFDWSNHQAWRKGAARRISLPTYPFAKERYWAPQMTMQGGPERQLHPLVHRNTSDFSEQRFSTTLTGDEFFLRDHVVQGKRIVPGAAQLEWARAAVTLASGNESGAAGLSVLLQEVVWLRPLVVTQQQEVHIGLERQEDGHISFEIYCDHEDGAVVYSQGWAQLAEAGAAPRVDLEALQAQCEQTLTGEEWYARFTQQGLDFGSSFRVLNELRVGHQIAVGALRLTAELPVGYTWAPNLLDGALQASSGLVQNGILGVPFAVTQVRQWDALPTTAWAVVRPGAGDSAAVRKLDIDIVDASGRVALRFSGFSARTLHEVTEPATVAPQTVLLAPQWTVQAITSPEAVSTYGVHGILLCEVGEKDPKTIDKLAAMVPVAQCMQLTQTGTLAQRYTAYAVQLLDWVQKKIVAHPRAALLLQLVLPNRGEGAVLQGLGGLLRSAQREYPRFAYQVVGVEAGVSIQVLGQRLLAEAASPTPVVRYVQGKRQVRDFALRASAQTMLPWRDQGVYLITGGLGGLGQIFARAIAQVRQPVLVLTGRGALKPVQERVLQELQMMGAQVVYRQVEASDAVAVAALVAEIVTQYGQLNGVMHSAGVLHDGLLVQKTAATVRQVLAPKVAGLVALDEATRDIALDWLVLCSSVAGVLGNVGQTDYAAGNGFMDAYAQHRADLVTLGQRQGHTVSVSWPLWAEGGMQVEARTQEWMLQVMGLEPMPSAVGVAALGQALAQNVAHVIVGFGVTDRVLQYLKVTYEAPLLQRLVPAPELPAAAAVAGPALPELAQHYLTSLLAKSLQLPVQRIDAQAPLEQYGIDSVMVVALTRDLEQIFGPISKTLFFEYQNIAALTQYFLQQHGPQLAALLKQEHQPQPAVVLNQPQPTVVLPLPAGHTRKRLLRRFEGSAGGAQEDVLEIAIIGLSGRYPQANTLEAYWHNLVQGVDCITEIPPERWDWRDHFNPQKGQLGKSYSKWGGFIDGVDEFDPLFFGISPREAEMIDPQERLFLQCAYSAIEDAGYTRASLGMRLGTQERASVGVFVGVMYEEYQLYGQAQGLGLVGSAASIANRVSYYGNFQGPSLAVDTMCSSSLTALHLACQNLRQGGCEVALAGGVNLTVHPNKYLLLSQGQFASSEGRCTSFGAGGDGYVPSEGVGVVVLKPLAQAVTDGDHIYGVIKGSALNHGGKTNGYTVPNPNAQAEVIGKALQMSAVHPRTISYVEAHGTGTALGDPIEITGLSKAFNLHTQDTQYCAIGSVKSNIGHCESAAGMAALTKVLLQMQHGQLVKSLHSETLNPHIAFEQTPFKVQQSFSAWSRPVLNLDGKEREYPRIAGISSFGAGGSNAHLIVAEYVPPQSVPTVLTGPVVVVLSARSEAQLRIQVQQLLAYLERQDEVNLADLAYTLALGREALGMRLALVVRCVDVLQERLSSYLQNQVHQEDLYQGESKRSQEALAVFRADEDLPKIIEAWISKGKLGKLAQLWVQGLEVEWQQLYGHTKPKRISLPTYPFAKERYWVPQTVVPGGLEPQLHPLLHRNTSDLSEQRFSTRLTGEEFFLRDYVVQGGRVVPAAAQLEWARAAVMLASGAEGGVTGLSVLLQDVTWLQPLAVQEAQEVHIALEAQQDGRISFEIYRDGADETVVYSQGWAQLAEVGEAPQVELAMLQPQCERTLTGEACYARFAQLGLAYGPSFQVLSELQVGNGIALGALRWVEEGSGYAWAPNALDGALQACVGLMQNEADATLTLPFAVAQVKQWYALPMPAWAVVRPGAGDRPAARKFEIDIVDVSGRVALRLSGFSMRKLDEATEPARVAPQTVLLAPQWTVQAIIPPEVVSTYGVHRIILCEVGEKDPKIVDQLAARMPAAQCMQLTQTGTLAQRYTAYAVQLLEWVQKEVVAHPGKALLLQLVIPSSGEGAVLQGLGGLLRSAQQEYPQLACQIVGVEASILAAELAQRLAAEAISPTPVVRYAQGKRAVWSFAPWESAGATLPWREEGVYLITGGLGELGQVFTRAMAQQVRRPVLVLTGRSALKSTQEHVLQELQTMGAHIVYRRVDVSDAVAVAALVAEIVAQYGQLNGVIHSAGVLQDGLLAQKTAATLRQVLAPKVAGLMALDEATRDIALDWLVLCSSVAGVLGNIGQTDYAAGNGFMDAYAQHRADLVTQGQRQGRTVSVAWPLWAEGGMQVAPATQARLRQLTGLEPLPSAAGMMALGQALAQNAAQVVVGYGAVARIRQRLRAAYAAPLPMLPSAASSGLNTAHPAAANALQLQLEPALIELISMQLKIPREKVARDIALSEFGFDSVTLAAFSTVLNQKYDLTLSPAVFFEYPTIAALAGYLAHKSPALLAHTLAVKATLRPEGSALSSPLPPPAPRQRRGRLARGKTEGGEGGLIKVEPIAVIGMSGYFPHANTLQEYWDNLVAGRDCITEISAERWSLDNFYVEDRHTAIAQRRSYNKWGGCIQPISTLLDTELNTQFFATKTFDAQSMVTDEQKVFAQVIWTLLESAGYTSVELNKICQSRVGVYVGMMPRSNPATEVAELNLKDLAPHSSSALLSMVSQLFNFRGPSIAIDARSASSMTAIHTACKSLAHGECEVAIAGGIALLYPELLRNACQLNILASHPSSSRSFSADSNGMLFSEGAGAVLLKPLSKAIRDKDTILCVIKSTVASHWGDTGLSGLPTPSVMSQSIKENLSKSGVDPRTISYVEAFAGGLPTGDALEVSASAHAFGEFTQDKQFCALGSVKPSIGHAVAASGISQLAKVILQIQHGQLTPTIKINSERLNSDWEDSPFYLQQKTQTWTRPQIKVNGVEQEAPRRAMVNSVGFGGFYAGAIIEEYRLEERQDTQKMNHTTTEQLIVLSAKTAEHLKAVIKQLQQFVENHAQFSLQDMAYTLQLGREEMSFRWAAVVQDRDSLLRALTFAAQPKKVKSSIAQPRTIFTDRIDQAGESAGGVQHAPAQTQVPQHYLAGKDLATMAAGWVKGASIAWELLHADQSPRRIELPTYPFFLDTKRGNKDRRSKMGDHNGVLDTHHAVSLA